MTHALAATLGAALLRHKHLLVTAESCTGGSVAQAITDTPGASQWFDCGFVTYSNHSKTRVLRVPDILISTHGAVSEAVAMAMARGALRQSQASIAIATTGIAGPDGGTPTKPVGTVWFGLATKKNVRAAHCLFSGDRQAVREQSVRHALRMLLEFVENGGGAPFG
ncbi:MAG: CinA family protein [Burkholderiaceae bacterium]|jgi:nicotinamide-nucleotide amidase|nr:CinA family protein [Burkholderiaceae bacterium]